MKKLLILLILLTTFADAQIVNPSPVQSVNGKRGNVVLIPSDIGALSSSITVTSSQGGTGLSAVGASGNVLTSNGTLWISSPVPSASGNITADSITGTASTLDITSKTGTGTGDGAALNIFSGSSGAGVTGNAGNVILQGNDTSATTGNGGSISILGGYGHGTGNGGAIDITAGKSFGGLGDIAGSDITITGGEGKNNGNGGNIVLVPGSGSGTGLAGIVSITGSLSTTLPIVTNSGGTGLTSAGTSGNVLTSNGTSWTSVAPVSAPVTSVFGQTGAIANLSGDVTTTGSSAVTLATVTTAKGGTGLTSAGTSGNVLTSNGTSWTSVAPVSGALIKLATSTLGSAASTINFLTAFSNTYNSYVIDLYNIAPSAQDYIRFRFAVAGTLDTASNYNYAGNEVTSSVGVITGIGGNSDTSSFIMSSSNPLEVNLFANAKISLQNINSSSASKTVVGDTTYAASATSTGTSHINTFYKNTAVVTGIGFYFNGGSNFKTGSTITIYGVVP